MQSLQNHTFQIYSKSCCYLDRAINHKGTGMLPVNTLLQGRYLIVEQIGRGGMGAVYKATDTRLRATVALKETLLTGDAARKAFEREAQLLAGLRHHTLPKVSDHFTEGEGQFLVME